MNKQLVNKFFESLKQDQQFNTPTSTPSNAEDFWKTLQDDQSFINDKLGGK